MKIITWTLEQIFDIVRLILKHLFWMVMDNNGHMSHIRVINITWAFMALFVVPYCIVNGIHVQIEIITLMGGCIGVYGVIAAVNKRVEMKHSDVDDRPEDSDTSKDEDVP